MEKRDLIYAIGFATIVLFLLGGFLLFFFIKYRYKSNRYLEEKEGMKKEFEETLLRSQVEVQEATFSILAKELHDNVGQLLSSCKMLLAITQRNLEPIPQTLLIAEETVSKAIIELRLLSKSLDKEWLEQFDLIENFISEVKRINSSSALEIHFSHEGRLPFQSEKQIILFRIIQEALQNAIKHSEAKNIDVNILTKDENIMVTIKDDGKGYHEITHEGFGVRNMKSRSKLLGGHIAWNTADKGASINIQIPLNGN